MTTFKFRPTFTVTTQRSARGVVKCLRDQVVAQNSSLEISHTEHHAMIFFVCSKRHFWSPWLHVETRPLPETNEVFCRFSPNPSVWTAFAFSYLALGVFAFFSIVLGMTQQLMDLSPWGYYLIPAWLLGSVLLWVVSQAGQRLAEDQMQLLKDQVIRALAENTTIEQLGIES